MKIFVNFLSAFRIAASLLIIPTIMLSWYWVTFILYALGAISDWFDGYLARKYNCCSKIGGVMDHIGDKLLVCNTLILLPLVILDMALNTTNIVSMLWNVVVPVILMIDRELYVSGLREFLGTQKIEMPVPKARFSLGKVKTTIQMISLAAFLLLFAIGTSITLTTSSRFVFYLIYILPQIGIFCLWFALVASLWSATQYTFTFIEKLKKIK